MTSGLHSHPEVPDGITPRSGRRSRPPGSLAPVPAWAPLAALVSAFVVATLAYLLIAAGVEAGGGNVTTGGPPGLVISATLVQDLALIAAAVAVRGDVGARPHAGVVRAAADEALARRSAGRC